VADRLAPENEVFVADNLSSGSLPNLEKCKGRITFIKGDIRDRPLVTDLVRETDFVFHLAADVGNVKSIEDPFGQCLESGGKKEWHILPYS
jgi:nucleoside-diphosphate-sugar epimerase